MQYLYLGHLCIIKKQNGNHHKDIYQTVKKKNRWEPPQGYIPYNEKIAEKIDNDIDELFDEDILFSDITRETLYINNKFDKLLDDINHMKNTVENIKKHNNIINIKSDYYNVD